MCKKRIYISGKITGLDIKVAEQYFEQVERDLAAAGFIPLNPFKILPFDPEHTWEDYMLADIKEIFAADGMLMLENWGQSRGARTERSIAIENNIPVFYHLADVENHFATKEQTANNDNRIIVPVKN